MFIPQNLAYAKLAGLPPQMGFYASILPNAAYALFGSSMTLAIANINVVEDRIEALLAADPTVQRVVLICSAVDRVDTTAVEVLRQIESGLAMRGIEFTLAEVKGPVMDRLRLSDFDQRLDGRVFVSVHDAFADAHKATSASAAIIS